MERPERQWPLPKDRQRPQTFLFGQSGIRRCYLSASSSDKINNGSKLPEKRKASAVCTLRSLHIGKSGTHFVRDVTFSGCSAPSWHRPLLLKLNGETEVSHSVTAIGFSLDARQDIHRQAAERLALMGRAVSVSQSLFGLRSCQSPPHGCCQRSGYAASVPTRPAKSVLGGFATSSAPAFPSSCAAAPAAAAAVRGSEVDYHCAAIRDKAHHLRLFALNYISTIDVLTLLRINTDQCQSLLSTAIPSIVDNETIFDSPLRGNFGPTSTTCSASPSLSSTHCGRER